MGVWDWLKDNLFDPSISDVFEGRVPFTRGSRSRPDIGDRGAFGTTIGRPRRQQRPSPRPRSLAPRGRSRFGFGRDAGPGLNYGVDLDSLNRFFRQKEEERRRAAMWGELERLQDPSRYFMDEAELRRQAQAAADAQYNPIISGLQQEMQGARTRAGRQKTELGQMFGALSRDISGDIPDIESFFEEESGGIEKQYKNLEGTIRENYAESQRDQEEMLKRLNIEAAAPDILPEQMADRDFFVGSAQRESQNLQSALGQEKRGDIGFTRAGSQMAQTEGTNRQADLMAELEDTLSAYRGQVTATELARTQAATSGYGDLQQQMRQEAFERSQQDFQNYLKVLELQQGFAAGEAGEEGEAPDAFDPSDPVKSPRDIAPTLSARYGGMLRPQEIRNIEDLIFDSKAINAAVDPRQPRQSPYYIASQVLNEARDRWKVVTPTVERALREIVLEYLGVR